MGGISDKPIHNTPITKHYIPQQQTYAPPPSLPHLDKDPIAKARFFESIKKRDIILFKKTLEKYNVKPTDLVGPPEQQKTVLHKLAEYNFSEAMALVLEAMANQKFDIVARIINMKDSDGNTPALLCCLSNSVETLEVLAKDEHVDLEVKNNAKKSALEISIEMESPCVNVLTTNPASTSMSGMTTKSTLKTSGYDSSQYIPSLEETGGGKGPRSDSIDLGGASGPNSTTSLGERRRGLSKDFKDSAKDIKDKEKEKDTFQPDFQSKMPQVLAELESKGTIFKDSEFPHEICYLDPDISETELKKKYPDLQWRRPIEFLGHHQFQFATIFNSFILADVTESPLVGCEFYSALAVMAEFPQRLSRVFRTKEINKYGLYSLNFMVAGISLEILLDDFFPCHGGLSLKPLYSRPVGNELWFLLLEKAFAKLYGGYKELENICIVEALEVLSGMPVSQHMFREVNEDRLWRKLMDYDKKNYILCVGEAKVAGNQSQNRLFNIIGLYEVDGCRLLKLRNHYGNYSWGGDFSINLPVWSRALREQVGYSPNDKTCFYMTITDLIKEFESLTVCHYHDNWFRNKVNITSKPKSFVYMELQVEQETEAYISIHQKQPEFSDEGPEYDISPVEVVMARDVDGVHLDNSAFGEHSAFLGKPTTYVHEGLESKLKQGRYIICVKVKWVDDRPHDFYLNILSSSPVKLTLADSSIYPSFLERVYLSLGAQSQDKFKMGNECEFVSGWVGSHLWMCAFNKGNKTWTLEVIFDKIHNLKIARKFRDKPNVIRFVILPNSKAVAYVKRTSVEEVAMKWRFEQSWEKVKE